MSRKWKKKSQEEIKNIIYGALEQNINYNKQNILGVPASYLDEKVFNQDAYFLKEAPFMFALTQNPNHIGCHTTGTSEPFFKGTHEIEKKLIEICATDILKGGEGEQDGYVASGGTEANIQAIWIYRNYYKRKFSAEASEIAIICSADSHYSMDKAANLLSIPIYKIPVDEFSRKMSSESIGSVIEQAKGDGVKHLIVVCNMMTTMFGSVDDIDVMTGVLETSGCHFMIHVDGAYGGFYYPFTDKQSKLTFRNPAITSFTLDAHKMAQSPYGTGIFLIRKNFIHYVNTKEASYVEGEDLTLIGSRSGANAIAVWMILVKNGPHGWFEKTLILQKRTEWLCEKLTALGIGYFRNPKSNIVAIRATPGMEKVASKFSLVPDSHSSPSWFKVVIMDHVTIEKLTLLVEDLEVSLS
ncbi:pyridoxal phosphate-dependent decarboxylase family protein [Portibacter lacus]|uniref:Cytochrome d ubiquinol oxidase subunit I n=1 Tax=Portibacter lacus TaxID=1099794 RepID=A0AA37SSK8_9BACT|nr:pyridoxal-dependent decarboxylase [Portibacter lacus]GLR19252.1 cytochrome d ubiquinol oxidase subunit I [Portibacter lacus]